jgi:hypothetical protein
VVGGLSATPGLQLTHAQPLGAPEESSTWIFLWDGVPERQQEVCLRLRYLGDPPVVRATTWLVPQAPPVEPAADPDPEVGAPAPPDEATVADRDVLVTYEWSYAFELERRAALIAEPYLVAKRFFLSLDRASHPQGLAPAEAEPIVRLGEYLANRYNKRALYRQDPQVQPDEDGDSMPLPHVEALTWKADVEHSAELLERLLAEHFPAGGEGAGDVAQGVQLDAVREAFERFGGGELTIFGPHGAPNGLNIFCFVELALFLVQSGRKPDLWGELLRAFGASCEIYVRSFHACGGDRSFCAYRVEHNPKGFRAPSDAQRLAIRKAWAGPLPIERYERLLQATLLEDLPPVEQPGVRPLEDIGCEAGVELLPVDLRPAFSFKFRTARLRRPRG